MRLVVGVRDPVVVAVCVELPVPLMVNVGLVIGLLDGRGDAVGVRLPVSVRVGVVVEVIDFVAGADSVARIDTVGVFDVIADRDGAGLVDADRDVVVVRVADGLDVAVFDAEVVGVMERVTAAVMEARGVVDVLRLLRGERVVVAELVAVRLRVGVRDPDADPVSVLDTVDVRVDIMDGKGDREPVTDRLIVRVAVTVLDGRAVRDTLTDERGVLLPVGVLEEVALARGVFVRRGDLVGVHVGRDVADGRGSPAANARRLPSMPISATGHGDPRTPPPVEPGENPIKHSRRRSKRILFWYVKQFLDGGRPTQNPGAPGRCGHQEYRHFAEHVVHVTIIHENQDCMIDGGQLMEGSFPTDHTNRVARSLRPRGPTVGVHTGATGAGRGWRPKFCLFLQTDQALC